jgi:aminoglycoside phosphotransferase (APT) family kinase protein
MNINQKELLNTINELLDEKIVNVIPKGKGNVNTTFKLIGESRNLFLRLFENNTWPEPTKLTWVDGKLRDFGIPHAKQVFYDRSDKYFPFGLEITDYIEGSDMRKMIEGDQIAYDIYYAKLGEMLSAIHEIKANSYGLVEDGNGTGAEFLDVVWDVYKNLDIEVCRKYFPQNFKKEALRLTETLLHDYLESFNPVLVHYDANPQNCIYTKSGQLTLVDWDNALFLPWATDLAVVTYWQQPDESFKKGFFHSYKKMACLIKIIYLWRKRSTYSMLLIYYPMQLSKRKAS